MIRIRFATAADIPALVELGREMHVESRYAWITFSADRVWSRLEAMLRDKNTCCFVAYDERENPIGFLLGTVERYAFATLSTGSLRYIYVLPAHRGGLLGIKLIHGFRKWALGKDVVEIHLDAHFGIDIGKTDRLFRRLGFQMVGGNYSRWVDQEAR